MGCTTLLVGKGATNDGSTIVARNEDCENGTFNPKSMIVVEPADQPRKYTGVNSHLTIELPANPLRYTCTPNTDSSNGVWGEAGINAANVSMSATETITSNARVLGADPLVTYQPQQGSKGHKGYRAERPGGIGEEDLVTIILPYIKTAREGVQRMGMLLEKYGTYEMNGVAFGDADEIWYIETIGGHHWIARRVPDGCYVAQPNRQGIDVFDLGDALGEQKNYMCSKDLAKWMAANHLCMDTENDDVQCAVIGGFVSRGEEPPKKIEGIPTVFDARAAFGSKTYHDMVYNAPRKWYMCKTLNPNAIGFQGKCAKYGPQSFDIPWAMEPERKISVSDVKDLLSNTYDGTDFNCYGPLGTDSTRHIYRNVGINRTCECSILAIRGYAPEPARGVQWIAMGSCPFNTAVAMFANVSKVPSYLDTHMRVTPDELYWADRLIAGLADPEYPENYDAILQYQEATMALGYESLSETDRAIGKKTGAAAIKVLEEANQKLADKVKEQTDALLGQVLFTRSLHMSNAYYSNDH